MIITSKRIHSNDDATLSTIFVDGEFQCFILEDEYRADKVAKETRIPAGIYKVGLRTVGGFHYKYSRKFTWHKGMLQLLNVPGFEYILIHIGNTDEDTEGCLLVGCGASVCNEITVQNSTIAYEKLYKKVIDAVMKNELLINIEDHDR